MPPDAALRRIARLASLAGALATPLGAGAQEAGRVYRLGYLAGSATPPSGARQRTWDACLLRLRELGYVEGQNLKIERRYSDGSAERLPALAAGLVRLNPDVIVALGTPATVAVRRQ